MKRYLILPALLLTACENADFDGLFSQAPAPDVQTVENGPKARPEGLKPAPPPPPPSARTVEQFDTTTEKDRAEALKAETPAGEQLLGTTNISLGSPTDPGIWLKTPLVSDIAEGRVEYPVNGKAVTLELRPSGGAAGSSSEISLAAMRLLGIPLTALADVKVFR